MAKSRRSRAIRAKPPAQPLPPAIPQPPIAHPPVPRPLAATPTLHKRMRHLWRLLAVGFWRGATLLSVSYLVYDRIYETDATISAPASDPNFPFTFPFSITNNSHVFAIRNVTWTCQYIKLLWGNDNQITDSREIRGSVSEILPGHNLNFDCAAIGPTSRFIRSDKAHVSAAEIQIAVTYEASLFGLFGLSRHPSPTKFTWFSDAANPQWVKGDFLK